MLPPRKSPADWSRLRHAHGTAEDTPGLLAELLGDAWSDAVGQLYDSLVHQGTVYPATVAAVPVLVDVATDRTAPGRLGALWLLGAYGRAVPPADLTTRATAATDDAARRLLPMMSDPDPRVRAAVYGFAGSVVDSPVAPALVHHLRRRFNREDDHDAAIALMGPLLRHGAFQDTDLTTLASTGDDALLFAAAWSAVAVGRDLPGAVDHLVRLWPERAADYPRDEVAGTSLTVLVEQAGSRATDLLRRLSETNAVPADTLVAAWVELAVASPTASSDALTGLLSLTPDSPTTAARLVEALATVRPATPDRAGEICDAADTLAAGTTDPALLTITAVTLFTARDERWAGHATRVIATCETEPMVGPDNWRRFSSSLHGPPARRDPITWAADTLLPVATAAIAAWPDAAPGWVELVADLPPTGAVVALLTAALPHAPTQASQALTTIALTHPEALPTTTRTPANETLRHLTRAGPGNRLHPLPEPPRPGAPPEHPAEANPAHDQGGNAATPSPTTGTH